MAERKAKSADVGRQSSRRALKPNRVKLLISILNSGDEDVLNDIINEFSVSLAFSCRGTGTVKSAVLSYLGIGSENKSIMFSLIPESDEIQILDSIRDRLSLYLVGRGISFTIPLSAVTELIQNDILSASNLKAVEGRNVVKDKDRKYDLIIAVLAAGFVDEAMDAAREAGAAGGTIIHAKSVGNKKAEQFLGVTLFDDAEILLILSGRPLTSHIMDVMLDKVGLKSEAKGVIYSLPVDRTAGVGGDSGQIKI